MNNVILCGRFTREHDMRYSQGTEPLAILSNSIAVGRKFKKGETDFINVKAFGKTAENISKFFSKGRLILIRGHIQTGSYEKEGAKVYTTDVIIDDFEFTGEKAQEQLGQSNSQVDGFNAVAETIDDDDLPF